MDGKRKNTSQKHTVKSVFTKLSTVILAIPFACGVCMALVLATDYFMDTQCFTEPKAFEWDGLVDVANAPENMPIINQENSSDLLVLNSDSLNVSLPRISSSNPLSHPEHSYSLLIKRSDRGSLAICQPSGWVSDRLSWNVVSYAFSPNGQFFALSSSNNIEIYDANSLELYVAHEFPDLGTIEYLSFHPSEPLMAFNSDIYGGQTTYIWNYETQEILATYPLQGGWVNFIAFNEDGTLLVIAWLGRESTVIAYGIPPE